MKKLGLLLFMLLGILSSEAQTDFARQEFLADTVTIWTGATGTIAGRIHANGTVLAISGATLLQFSGEIGFASAAQLNMPRALLSQRNNMGAGASENPLLWVTDPSVTGQNFQFSQGAASWRAFLHVAAGQDPTDGTLLLWQGDTIAASTLTVSGSNIANVGSITASGTILTTGDFSGTNLGLSGTMTADGITLGSPVQVGSITLYNGINANTTTFRTAGAVSSNRTLYYADETQAIDTISTREWVRTTSSSLPTNVDFSTKTSFRVPSGASPTVDAVGKLALDTDGFAASQGMMIYWNGTRVLGLLPFDNTDNPNNGDMAVWDDTEQMITFGPSVKVSNLGLSRIPYGVTSDSMNADVYLNWVEADTMLQLFAGTSKGGHLRIRENSLNGSHNWNLIGDESMAQSQDVRTSDVTYRTIPFHAPSAAATWTDKPAALTVFLGATGVHATRTTLTSYLRWRLIVTVITGSAVANSFIGMQYSTDGSTWRGLDNNTSGAISTVTITDEVAGILVSSWANLAGNAQAADIYLRVVGTAGGDGDPAFGMVTLEVQ